VVPWVEYEALRQQHAEGVQAFHEMASILQGFIPYGSIPTTLRKFILEIAPSQRAHQEAPINSTYREVTIETNIQSAPPRGNQPRSRLRGAER